MSTPLDIIANFVDNASDKINGLVGTLGNIGAVAGGAVVAGVGLATAAVVGSVNAFGDWAGQLDSIGDVLGTSADESAAFVVAIESVGGNVEGITGQMAKLTQGLVNAKGELGPTGKILTDMGVAFQDANGKMLSSTEIMTGVADKLNAMPDGLEKSTLMMDLFGKSGKDMTDTLGALGSEGFDSAMQKAKEYGLAVGDEGVNASVEMGKAQAELGLMLKGIATQIGAEVLPALLPLAQQFIAFAQEHLPPLLTALGEFGKWIGTIATAIGEFVSSDEFIAFLTGLKSTIEDVFGGIQTIVEKVWPIIQRIFGLIAEIFKTVFGTLFEDQKQMQVDTEAIWAAIELVITTVLNAIEFVIKTVLAVVKGVFKGDWTEMKKIVDDILTAIKTAVETEITKVGAAIKAEFDATILFLTGLPKQMIQFGKDLIQGFIDGIASMGDRIGEALIASLPQALRDFAKSLGLFSPSRVFYEYGKNVMEGFALGIADNADLARLALGGAGANFAANARAGNSFAIGDRINVSGGTNVAMEIYRLRQEATRQAVLRAQIVG